jgi:queuine tRNA-ribosyltransferase
MPSDLIREMTQLTCELLPFDRPRHLLGVGLPTQILDGIEDGADTFDCVLPIRKAQRGVAYTRLGVVRYKDSSDQPGLADTPLDLQCGCSTCKKYSRAELRRLYREQKDAAGRLAAIHNLTFYHGVLEGARHAIRRNQFSTYKSEFVSNWISGGEE